MALLLKLLFAGGAVGWTVYSGNALVLVVITPLAAVIFTNDIINMFGGSVRAMRTHAYDSDARVFKYGYTHIRMILFRNRAWFEAAPVCQALGYREVDRSIRHYATTDYCVRGSKKEPFLSESGVRRLATLSRHGEAKAFLRWFDLEVVTMLETTRKRMKSSIQDPLDIDLSESPPDKS